MKRLIFLLLPAAMAVLPARGGADVFDWVYLGRDAEGVPVYYDAERVAYPARDTVGVVVKAAYDELEAPVRGREDYGYAESAVEVRCLENMYQVLETDVYARDGSLLGGASPYRPGWAGITRGSAMQRLHEAVCPREETGATPDRR